MRTLVTGSSGLVGSEAVKFFSKLGECFGIDNNMRAYFFGNDGSTLPNKPTNCTTYDVDIRSDKIGRIFAENKFDLIIHTAAQPSHDWAKIEPETDFTINANGTLNLLENYRKYTPNAVFIYVSTNKVYGDAPNRLDLVEYEKRYDREDYIDETMSIDTCMHSLFGVSKLSGDLLTQEYGRYFGLQTGIFRCGCLTGANHAGVKLHGFLSYLIKCAITNDKYIINGYKGKQVRDNLHAEDLITAFYEFYKSPKCGEVYNIGGGLYSNISILEAIHYIQMLTGRDFNYSYIDEPRKGDHIWYITDLSKFKKDYPNWEQKHWGHDIIKEMYNEMRTPPIP